PCLNLNLHALSTGGEQQHRLDRPPGPKTAQSFRVGAELRRIEGGQRGGLSGLYAMRLVIDQHQSITMEHESIDDSGDLASVRTVKHRDFIARILITPRIEEL